MTDSIEAKQAKHGPDTAAELQKWLAAVNSGPMDNRISKTLVEKAIAALAANAQMAAALRPFAAMCDRNVKPDAPDGDGCPIVMSNREMRRARAALAQPAPDPSQWECACGMCKLSRVGG